MGVHYSHLFLEEIKKCIHLKRFVLTVQSILEKMKGGPLKKLAQIVTGIGNTTDCYINIVQNLQQREQKAQERRSIKQSISEKLSEMGLSVEQFRKMMEKN